MARCRLKSVWGRQPVCLPVSRLLFFWLLLFRLLWPGGAAADPWEREAALVRQDIRELSRAAADHPDLDWSGVSGRLAGLAQLPDGILLARKGDVVEIRRRMKERLREYHGLGEDYRWELRLFSPNGFKRFYDRLEPPGTDPRRGVPEITGHGETDRRIVRAAEARGYRLRPQAREERLEGRGSHRLQPEVWPAWDRLCRAAAGAGYRLGLVSGYRSAERQRFLFLARLNQVSQGRYGKDFSWDLAGAGELVDAILQTSSIPGYSKHHTGCTLDAADFSSEGAFTSFGETAVFAWLSGDNYAAAKEYGFLPSYPEGAENQGPRPEPWEYVYVGRELLVSTVFRGD